MADERGFLNSSRVQHGQADQRRTDKMQAAAGQVAVLGQVERVKLGKGLEGLQVERRVSWRCLHAGLLVFAQFKRRQPMHVSC